MSTFTSTVLVVDDEACVREVLSRYLQRLGYQVLEAEDGLEALKIAMATRFDAVLLDQSMPGMDGHEVLAKIQGLHPDAAVLMVTAIDDVSAAARAMRNGACDYILKPVDFSELYTALERALHRRAYRHKRAYLDSVAVLARALEAKDPYTQGHSERVTVYALRLAQHLGLPRSALEEIEAAGPLHDIGKIGIRETVLLKPGALTDEEFAHIKEHPGIGARMLEHVPGLEQVRRIVRHHHEWFDGAGYPDQLAGEDIPLGARILSVADAFDAMTSKRPYREVLPDAQARANLLKGAGTHFDPDPVRAFVELLDRSWLPGRPGSTAPPPTSPEPPAEDGDEAPGTVAELRVFTRRGPHGRLAPILDTGSRRDPT